MEYAFNKQSMMEYALNKQRWMNMNIQLDFTFESGKGQPKDSFAAGITEIVEGLFVGGEEDVSDVLPFVQVWIDLRDENPWNRIVEIPSHVVYMRIPIADGDIHRAYPVFRYAKHIAEHTLQQGEKVVISCHAGVSRSAVLAWWILADMWKDPQKAWSHIKQKRPCVEPDDRFLPFIKEHILSIACCSHD